MGIVVNSRQLERELARRGWTHADLARAAGISGATVAAAAAGRRVAPQTLRQIAEALIASNPIEGVDALLTDNPGQTIGG